MIVDVPTSSVALAVNQITKEKNKVFLNSGAASSDLTGKACSPNTVHWTYDTYALANGTGGAMVKAGGDTWFFLTADYAFGHALERDTEAVVTKNGGKVLGKVRHPLHRPGLLLLPAAGPGLEGARSSASPTPAATPSTRSSRRASSASSRAGRSSPGCSSSSSDVQALGLQTAQGLVLTESFYWDLNDQTRDFSKRFGEKFQRQDADHGPGRRLFGDRCITSRRSRRRRSKDPEKVIAKMKEMPTDDPVFGKGSIRADGRKIHPMYLFEVKKPAESKGKYDLYKLVATLPAETGVPPARRERVPAREEELIGRRARSADPTAVMAGLDPAISARKARPLRSGSPGQARR